MGKGIFLMSEGMMKNPAIGRSWDEFKKGIPTPAKQAEVDLEAPLIGEMIKAWKELGMMQKKRQQSAGRIDSETFGALGEDACDCPAASGFSSITGFRSDIRIAILAGRGTSERVNVINVTLTALWPAI